MVIIIIDIIFIVVTYFLWNKYGKDSMLDSIDYESYPPNHLNSAEVGQIYRGYTEDVDILSLVIYLANKGYLKIEKIKEAINLRFNRTPSRSFKISKLKDYDGTNKNEKTFFNELFAHSDEVTKKFDTINLQMPEWFSGNLEYETPKINRDINITFEQICVAMITHSQTNY